MRNTNNLRDKMPLGKQQINELSFSEKMEYYWQKYKIHIVVTVLLACFFGSILHPIIHRKETVLSIACINAFPNVDDQVIIDDFEKHLQLNSKKQQVLLDSTYYIDNTSDSPYALTYSQKFSVNAMAGNIDIRVMWYLLIMTLGNTIGALIIPLSHSGVKLVQNLAKK